MRGQCRSHPVSAIAWIFVYLTALYAGDAYADANTKYLDAVIEFADNVLKYGRDTYSPKHTPLFVDGLNIYTHEPVKWIAPNGDRWILSNLASQQNLFRALDGLTKITGDPKYKQAAMDAIRYAFDNLRSPNGLLYWGNRVAYDAQADEVCTSHYDHELKHSYPYYELMWQVDSKAVRQFIDSFWSAHIIDWSNLDMNRLAKIDKPLERAWGHNYEGGPVFFKSKLPYGLSFHNAASDLCFAGSLLYKLSGEKEPLVWSKRLIYRYIETRDPKIGISGQLYSQKQTDRAQDQFGDDFRGHLVLEGTLFPSSPISPISMALQVRGWVGQFILGDLLGSDGVELTKWALEELTAWGKVSYRKEDNSFVPMLIDGTSLEGYVFKKDGYYGPKDTVVHAMEAGPVFFWAYALAYRVTGDPFMWEMARNIAGGNSFGEIGVSPKKEPHLVMDTDCSASYTLLGFLELYSKTQNDAFLKMASRIGDNILVERFYRGFFVLSKEVLYTKFDYVEPLALLHLDATIRKRGLLIPQVWPSRSFFEAQYYEGSYREDTIVIYSQSRQDELSMLLLVAAWSGNTSEVKTLISRGADVNAHFKFDSRIIQRIMGAMDGPDIGLEAYFAENATPLHYASEKGHKDIVEFLIANGAGVNTKNNDGQTPLHLTAENAQKDIAELLIASSVDINAKDTSGQSPLHYAAERGLKNIVELLLANGADINAKNNEGKTPVDVALSRNRKDIVKLLVAKGADFSLHTAARLGLDEIVELLLAKGADVGAKNNEGWTASEIAMVSLYPQIVKLLANNGADISSIHLAASVGDLAKVKAFLQEGIDIKAQDSAGRTPLHYAATADVAELLLSSGANIHAVDKSGETPLHTVAGAACKDVVELLITKGADVDAKEPGYTPLSWAIWRGQKDVIRSLVVYGADLNFVAENDWPFLHYAVWNNDKNLVEFFVNHGAKLDVKDGSGWTVLHYASNKGYKEIVDYLVSKGADINAETTNCETALSLAKEKGHTEIVELLRKHGAKEGRVSKGEESPVAPSADINKKTYTYQMPLHKAAAEADFERVKSLISNGADVNAESNEGWTALHRAAVFGHTDVVKFLLGHGAEVNTVNRWGWTPQQSAALYGHRAVVELLLANGADISAKTPAGETSLQIATERGYKEIVEFLRKHGA